MTKILPTLLAAAVLAGCATMQNVTKPQPSDWDRTLYHARQAVDAHNYYAADRLLDEYVRTHPASTEANEIAFWKAAYILDPDNDRGSLGDGIVRLDAYLASNPNGMYREEATLLRRTAAIAQGVASTARTGSDTTATAGVVKDTVVVVKRSRDEEIASLKEQLAKSRDELAKVSAELERIKKRLANPNG
jgi:outer membrane protein assembly factor BamD (BamD/ComL family)